MNLLNNDETSYISKYIYESEVNLNLSSFEYVEEFELLLLKEFEAFKIAFEKLDYSEKNDVIKVRNKYKEQDFYKFLEFSPENLLKFNVNEYYNIKELDFAEIGALINYPSGKIFYLEHYTSKFKCLISYFLIQEENYLINKVLNPLFIKIEFNPLEFLSINISQEGYFENKKKDLLVGVSKKFKGNLFWLFDKLEIKKNTHTAVEVFCQELCALYNTEYTDYIRQEYREVRISDKGVFFKQVLHLLPEDQKAIIRNYVESIVRK